MSGGLPGQPRHKLTDEQMSRGLVEKINEDSGKGVFVQICSCVETDVGITPLASVDGESIPINLFLDSKVHSDCKKHINYYAKGDQITGFLQSEFEQELTAIERDSANCLSVFLIKNGKSFSAQRMIQAISIETGLIDIWLNKITASTTIEQILHLDDTVSMVNYFYSASPLSENIDGLLLMQSLGYNAKTPYAQFMSLWVVLEKIITKSFKKLSKKRIYEISKGKTDLLNKRTCEHLKCVDNDSIRSVDKMKFNIADKLIIAASAAGVKIDGETLDLFRQVKKVRDGLHSSVSENGSFPTESIYKILQKVCG
jgi:hypothetical protein